MTLGDRMIHTRRQAKVVRVDDQPSQALSLPAVRVREVCVAWALSPAWSCDEQQVSAGFLRAGGTGTAWINFLVLTAVTVTVAFAPKLEKALPEGLI